MAHLYTIRKTEAKERITAIKLEEKRKTSKSAFLKIYIWNKQKRATLMCVSELGCLFKMKILPCVLNESKLPVICILTPQVSLIIISK